MLDTLHRIVKEVNAAPDLGKALATIVTLVKQAISCDVCSVYLTDADTRANVLAASDGLRQEAVGKVALPPGGADNQTDYDVLFLERIRSGRLHCLMVMS